MCVCLCIMIAHANLLYLLMVVVVVVVVVGEEIVLGNVTAPPVTDPLQGLFVRQEASIRKLDGLTAKIVRLDDLETKIDALTLLLQEREDQLEALVETLGARVEEVAGKVEEVEKRLVVVDAQVVALGNKVEGVSDVVTLVDGKVEGVGDRVEEVDGRVVELREAVEEAWMEMNQTLENLRGKTAKETNFGAISPATTSLPLEELHSLLLNLTEKVVEEPESSGNDKGCREAVRHLQDLIKPLLNASHHLTASVINRIRVSNLAMDKRLGAILHALSMRHHLLGDGLHKAISSLHTRLSTHLRELFSNVERKVEEVEDIVRSNAKDVIDIFTASPSISSTTTTSTTRPPLQQDVQEVLQETLDSILHLSNLTLHHLLLLLREDERKEEEEKVNNVQEEQRTPMCLVPSPDNTTTTTTATTTTCPLTPTPLLQDAVREALRERLVHLEEQLAGLRIYLSTSLHVHATQVEDRVSLVEAGLLQVVQETLSKSNRGLEKLRRASLGYLDAAVTSVSSAAVASAQATADHLSRTLQEVALSLARRLSRVEVAVRAAIGGGGGGDGGGEGAEWQRWWWWWWCPAIGAAGSGGGACLSATPGNVSGWASSRRRCREVGGDLLISPTLHTSLHPLLHPLRSAPPIPSFWVGGRRVLGEWRWVTGALVEGEVGEGGDSGEERECLSVEVGENESLKVVAASCHTPRPALCQLPAPTGDDPGPPVYPESNEVNPIASHYYLTPEDLTLA